MPRPIRYILISATLISGLCAIPVIWSALSGADLSWSITLGGRRFVFVANETSNGCLWGEHWVAHLRAGITPNRQQALVALCAAPFAWALCALLARVRHSRNQRARGFEVVAVEATPQS